MIRSAPSEASDSDDHKWIATIERAQKSKAMRAWGRACEVIRKKYRYEDSTIAKTRKYQMLWSNTQTMQGATYVKPPKAEVQRRYRDKDSTARQATIMVERCINYTFDAEEYDEIFKLVRDDYLLFARGQARVVYEPVMEAVALPDDGLDGADVEGVQAELAYVEDEAADEDGGAPEPDEILTFERVKLKFMQREDFAHSPARIWSEVTWVAFRSFLDRDELRKRFKDKTKDGKSLGDEIPLTAKNDAGEGDKSNENDGDEKAEIWEVWDKAKNEVSWVAVGWPEILETSEPYLKFAGFFPCPKPAYGTMTSDTLAPRPDYIFYQDQAEQIDRLTARIDSLQDSLKLVGFYPAGPAGEGSPEIERAATPGVENKLIAVKSWAMFTEGGKGGVPIVWLPIEQVGTVLESCVKLRGQLIEDVNQIYGITDIMRGQGDPNETATAQGLKSQGGSLRIRTRQAELARFCRDVTRLVGEVICNHFQPETIMAMANMPLPTDADVLRQIQAQRQQQMMQQIAAQHAAAFQQQQAAMMGHNGGPPMNGPQPAPQPQGAQMGMHA